MKLVLETCEKHRISRVRSVAKRNGSFHVDRMEHWANEFEFTRRVNHDFFGKDGAQPIRSPHVF
jgi:hypothetical protein